MNAYIYIYIYPYIGLHLAAQGVADLLQAVAGAHHRNSVLLDEHPDPLVQVGAVPVVDGVRAAAQDDARRLEGPDLVRLD